MTPSSNGTNAMGTDGRMPVEALLGELANPKWSMVLESVMQAERWLVEAGPGASGSIRVVEALVECSKHAKWEVRRAVAQVAGQVQHSAFESALARLATDDNSRVRQAADQAAGRRRDWKNSSLLGRQHEENINSKLEDVEARFGLRARDAVRRASEEIANTYARELYHEVIKVLTPLSMSADRLGERVSDHAVTRADLLDDVARIQRRTQRIRTIVDAMRAFTAPQSPCYAHETLKDIVDEAAALVRDSNRMNGISIGIDVRIPPPLAVEVDRGRLVQAFTNVLCNATEAYDGLLGRRAPVIVEGIEEGTRAILTIQDAGCGMTEEAVKDAATLFTTNKRNGTGFGLPLAIKIVESEHGGQLLMTSERGVGTRVEVRLPRLRG